MSSTTIRDGIEQLETKLKAERAIAERFPDAQLLQVGEDYHWVSDEAFDHVTDVELVHGVDQRTRDRERTRTYIEVRTYLTVEGMKVYAPSGGNSYYRTWLRELKDQHPEVYKALVEAAK